MSNAMWAFAFIWTFALAAIAGNLNEIAKHAKEIAELLRRR